MAEHTPGPWHVSQTHNIECKCCNAYAHATIRGGADNWAIALVWGDLEDSPSENANLIAKAPTLRDALARLLKAVQNTEPLAYWNELEAAEKQAAEALGEPTE